MSHLRYLEPMPTVRFDHPPLIRHHEMNGMLHENGVVMLEEKGQIAVQPCKRYAACIPCMEPVQPSLLNAKELVARIQYVNTYNLQNSSQNF